MSKRRKSKRGSQVIGKSRPAPTATSAAWERSYAQAVRLAEQEEFPQARGIYHSLKEQPLTGQTA